jgi:hypothetical protein
LDRADGSDLLVVGSIDFVGEDYISVVGQTVFGSGAEFAGLAPGSTIAVYGEIDSDTGGYVDTSVVTVDSGSSQEFLRSTVDSVDTTLGIAVVGGVAVNYTALLATGEAPQVGDEYAVSGRRYRDLGIFVAE